MTLGFRLAQAEKVFWEQALKLYTQGVTGNCCAACREPIEAGVGGPDAVFVRLMLGGMRWDQHIRIVFRNGLEHLEEYQEGYAGRVIRQRGGVAEKRAVVNERLLGGFEILDPVTLLPVIG